MNLGFAFLFLIISFLIWFLISSVLLSLSLFGFSFFFCLFCRLTPRSLLRVATEEGLIDAIDTDLQLYEAGRVGTTHDPQCHARSLFLFLVVFVLCVSFCLLKVRFAHFAVAES
jgi:hypothetical protein